MTQLRYGAIHSIIAVLSALLFALICAIPTTYTLDIGGYDSAYVQGFFDQEAIPAEFGTAGMARWSSEHAAIIVPQYADPTTVTLRVAAPVTTTLVIQSNGVHDTPPFIVTPHWQSIDVTLRHGTWKPFTQFLALESPTAPWHAGDLRPVGVLLDTVTIHTPAWAAPYPWACFWVFVCSLLCGIVCRHYQLASWQISAVAIIVPIIVASLGWRWQFWYPVPNSPALVSAVLGIVLIQRHWGVLQRRMPWWADALSWGCISMWGAFLVYSQRAHVTLAIPGVEKDFRSFATRTDSIVGVFSADPFYHLGYPFIIYSIRMLTGMSAFDSAKWWAVVVACLALVATWWLARFVLGPRWGMFMTLSVASSTLMTQYALSLGSDMTFTALCISTFAILVRAPARPRWFVWAGVVAGLAFVVRHTGLVLLVSSMLWVWSTPHPYRTRLRQSLSLLWGWLIGAGVQLYVNFRDTQQFFYNHQAKNSWLAVYGNLDWGRWSDVNDTISLQDVIFNDPIRFGTSWFHNVVGVWGSTLSANSEQALFLRLLSFPMNWLSIAGLLLALSWWWQRRSAQTFVLAGIWLIGFVGVSAIAFILPRFLLPQIWVAAFVGSWLMARLSGALTATTRFWVIVCVCALQLSGIWAGRNNVIEIQPADERAVFAYVQAHAPAARVAYVTGRDSPLGKYTALVNTRVYRTIQAPVDINALCSTRPDIIVWSLELQRLPDQFVPTWQQGRYAIVRGDACTPVP